MVLITTQPSISTNMQFIPLFLVKTLQSNASNNRKSVQPFCISASQTLAKKAKVKALEFNIKILQQP